MWGQCQSDTLTSSQSQGIGSKSDPIELSKAQSTEHTPIHNDDDLLK